MNHILHLNDNNIIIQAAEDTQVSQGYAWLQGDQVWFDTDPDKSPVEHCRLEPQQINSRYWQYCEQSAIPSNGAGMRHAADLVWKHLSELKNKHSFEQVQLVVPPHYQQAQLQLLLGIAQACDLTVSAMVHKAVLAYSQLPLPVGRYRHVDLQLHQAVLSHVERSAQQLRLLDVEIIQGVGIQSIQDTLLKLLQSQFIQGDRFDPLHHADTEQQLFDQLPSLAAQLEKSSKATVSVQHVGQMHSVTIDAKQWNNAIEQSLGVVLEQATASSPLYLDCNNLFGEARVLESSPRVIEMGSPASFDALSALIHANTETDHAYLSQLELGDLSASEQAAVSIAPAKQNKSQALDAQASHLLLAGKALPIERCLVGFSGNQLSLTENANGNVLQCLSEGKLFIMNEQTRQALQPNDRLGSQLADGVITVIQVLEG